MILTKPKESLNFQKNNLDKEGKNVIMASKNLFSCASTTNYETKSACNVPQFKSSEFKNISFLPEDFNAKNSDISEYSGNISMYDLIKNTNNTAEYLFLNKSNCDNN